MHPVFVMNDCLCFGKAMVSFTMQVMKMESIWKCENTLPTFEAIRGNQKTDVLIIGGGIAGLLCAYKLQNAGVSCIIAEADRICSGTTGNTTAKITAQHGLIYHKLTEKFGVDTAQGYYLAQNQALKEYKKLCEGMACDYEEKPSIVYSCQDRKALEEEAEALERIGCAVTVQESVPMPIHTVGGVKMENQAQFHPLKFLSKMTEGLQIYENTRVLELVPGGAITNRGKIQAEKIIVATHFPMLNKHGMYFTKLYQHRSYVLALRNAQNVGGMYVDADQKGMSFRNYGDILLLGGGSHRTGKSGGCWQELTEFAQEYYPGARTIGKWATQDCMTLDGMPYIGQYSKNTPNLYVATGFNKWGMTSSMVAADILCDFVRGKQNAFAPIFDPSRNMLHPQLAINAFESVKGLLTPTAPRCPHLGCALKYNKAEHSWDCACHGSRFSETGKLLNNPATGDKKLRH